MEEWPILFFWEAESFICCSTADSTLEEQAAPQTDKYLRVLPLKHDTFVTSLSSRPPTLSSLTLSTHTQNEMAVKLVEFVILYRTKTFYITGQKLMLSKWNFSLTRKPLKSGVSNCSTNKGASRFWISRLRSAWESYYLQREQLWSWKYILSRPTASKSKPTLLLNIFIIPPRPTHVS